MLVALGLTAVGLVLLFLGLERGVPLVFFGTAEEREAREAGRVLVVVAAVVLLAPGALFAARGRPVAAALVVAAALFTAALVFAFPDAGWAWLSFIFLGGAAAIAALVTTLAGRG